MIRTLHKSEVPDRSLPHQVIRSMLLLIRTERDPLSRLRIRREEVARRRLNERNDDIARGDVMTEESVSPRSHLFLDERAIAADEKRHDCLLNRVTRSFNSHRS